MMFLLALALVGCNGPDDPGPPPPGDSPPTTDTGGTPGDPEPDCFDDDRDGWTTCGGDCDDSDPAVHPGAAERCDGFDQDCDGVGEVDADDDGFLACEDCDDLDASVRPGAPELCDGKDNDCNFASDEPFDGDGDGWGACLDCDDDAPTVNPGAVEVCDGLDNDCDLDRDEGFDLDGDGFASCRGDCDDADPDVHPWAAEICNGADDDCNGIADDTEDLDGDGYTPCALVDPDCDDLDPHVHPGAIERCNTIDDDCDGALLPDELDEDGDGEPICAGDCDDLDPLRASGFAEACDGVDNDCDPTTDEGIDGDGDGFSACDGDCDDREALAVPGGIELCNATDDDCDGTVDGGGVCGPCAPEAYGGHTYLFCDVSMTWSDARAWCLGRGYDLVAIHDEPERNWVTDVAWSIAATSWWGGFNDRSTEGGWEWSNGDPVTYTSWAPGEPNNSGNEDCGQLGWSGYDWNDAGCSATGRFVCEAP